MGWALVALVMVGMIAEDEPAGVRAATRKECRQTCAGAIDACVAEGGRRKRCKRQTLKRCRKLGSEVCAVPATTGSSTTTTTITIRPGGGGVTTTLASQECTHDTAVDLTSPTADRTVQYEYARYIPSCLRIAAGQSVLFSGIAPADFVEHPLAGGMHPNVDFNSPIRPTDTGSSTPFMFPSSGTFPFFCIKHDSIGMFGTVYVDP